MKDSYNLEDNCKASLASIAGCYVLLSMYFSFASFR